jgi:hypothetical protein
MCSNFTNYNSDKYEHLTDEQRSQEVNQFLGYREILLDFCYATKEGLLWSTIQEQ